MRKVQDALAYVLLFAHYLIASSDPPFALVVENIGTWTPTSHKGDEV